MFRNFYLLLYILKCALRKDTCYYYLIRRTFLLQFEGFPNLKHVKATNTICQSETVRHFAFKIIICALTSAIIMHTRNPVILQFLKHFIILVILLLEYLLVSFVAWTGAHFIHT